MNLKAPGLAELLAKVDRLSLRERVILLLLGLALTWALADGLLRAPLARQLQALDLQGAAAAKRIEAADAVLAELGRRADPDADLRRRLANVRDSYQGRLDATADLRASLIPARDMPALLEDLVAAYPGLRLVGLKNLAPEPAGPAAAGARPALYRHGVELEVAGGYAQLVGFLRRAEAMPRRPFWDSAVLDASRHPELHLKLRLYTLSEEAAWLAL